MLLYIGVHVLLLHVNRLPYSDCLDTTILRCILFSHITYHHLETVFCSLLLLDLRQESLFHFLFLFSASFLLLGVDCRAYLSRYMYYDVFPVLAHICNYIYNKFILFRSSDYVVSVFDYC
jgi:hypothetical protein